jgi:uncharacterized protein YdeI (YjbR/CyaY-like superfamily)
VAVPSWSSEAIFFETPEELRDWLDEHHATALELFVGAWKKSTGKPTLTWLEIVEEALCVGWIDSIRRSVPGDGWTIRLTPRRKGGNWSAVNIAKVKQLIDEGRMRPAGLAAFEARSDERSAMYSYEQRHIAALEPEDKARFRSNESAWAWFEARPASYRTAAVYWIVSAKRPETRAKRLATLIEDSAAKRPVQHLAPRTRSG